MTRLRWPILAGAALALAALAWLAGGWWLGGGLERDREFTVPQGASLTRAAEALAEAGAIGSADSFLLRAKVLGSGEGIQAGEFLLPAGASEAQILDILQRVLDHQKIKFVVLTGSTPVDARQSLVDEFTEDESIQVFLLSTKAGGMGINLTAASVVIM